jgi:mono/diheme cytochrome c family protein/glucose/arabinose dehydrogenase
MCDGGDTPGFRPHSGRNAPWAFPGAEQFQTVLANPSGSEGHLDTPDQWLERLKPDILLAFFGYNESFAGVEGLENFKAELSAFIDHTKQQKYNGQGAPHLVLVSPIAFEDLTSMLDLPDGKATNQNLKSYTAAMAEVAEMKNVDFINIFEESKDWMAGPNALTIDGVQLNEAGYQKLSTHLADVLFGSGVGSGSEDEAQRVKNNKEAIHQAVLEKNWFWHNDFKIPNGVHVFGRRYKPFGPDNYPAEIVKIREMTDIRDQAIWAMAQGKPFDVESADAKTSLLPAVETNYKDNGNVRYLYGQEALATISTAPGYKIELFASEKEFPDLANPVQLSFDNKGRLWVAVMPTYPHWRPGDPKPNDKLLILEDTDNDGKADKQTIFADGLHIPVGFELSPEGVYVSQGTNLILLTDSDGDDHADKKEILLSGFDDHDTHHVISAFCADPSGALYMGEGVFLHTNVETAYGPVRATNGGFYRYAPQRHHLERTAQLPIPNPWGIAFDEWGQNFYAETSGPDVHWMMPGTVNHLYGEGNPKSANLIEDAHRVRPTSGLEFVSSRHFPDDVQGDMLINNTIGFLGTKQHQMIEEGTGYTSKHRLDLVQSTDPNFRPVDMEFAPDGSLYLVDWHNVLVGHMQHNARDPLRDHVHGRIYRITYPSRSLVQPAKIAGESVGELLNNLKLPEYRTRYRTRRELRGRDASQVLTALGEWLANLDQNDSRYDHHKLEALWVSWGLNQVDQDLLRQLLQSKDHRVRAAATKVLRYVGHQVEDQADLLMEAIKDPHGRVRLEAVAAASWLDKEKGLPILEAAAEQPMDSWIEQPLLAAVAHIQGLKLAEQKAIELVSNLKGRDRELYVKGKEIYQKEGYCMTCHQQKGEGLTASQFPPLAGTAWVTGDEERLIKLTIKGLYGPIEIKGKKYPGQVPMTPFGGLLDDEGIAAVLTYVRKSFGNNADVVYPETVEKVRAEIDSKEGFYTAEELLEQHPM